MAPKRAPKKAAPPLPPAESSDDGSRSRSDDSEDEEAIAESPVPAATPVAPNNKPAPPHNGDESESSDDEADSSEEEEEEEEPAPVAPKNRNRPLLQQKNKEDSDTSGSDEEEEEPTRAAPPSALKKQPPHTSADQGESDGEAPPPKPAPKKAEGPPPAAATDKTKTKKPAGFRRIWSSDDEVRILEALAAHKEKQGEFPKPDALIDIVAGKLDNSAYGSKELKLKIKELRRKCVTLSKRGEVSSKEHDRRLLNLSKIVWDIHQTAPAASGAAKNAPNNGQERKGFEEMCELYPYLAEEVKGLEAVHPGMCKREFGKMDDDKACTMDEKIKKQRLAQIKVEMRRSDLVKEVTKALIDLVNG